MELAQPEEIGISKPKRANIWDRHPDDWYVEDGWVSQRLFEVENFEGNIVDPACGLGRIVSAARTSGLEARGYDKVHRSDECQAERDFLSWQWPDGRPVQNIVCNPPFKHAEEFVKFSLDRARIKVAMLLPATWLYGDERSRWLETTPLYRVLAITPRPSMPPGPVIEAGLKPGGGTKDFCWMIWLRGYRGPWQGGWMRRRA